MERDAIERQRAPLAALPGSIRLRHYEPERDYQLGQQGSAVAGGAVREERIDLPAVLPASSARALAQRLAAAAADGRETLVWHGDLAALALPVGRTVELADGSAWRLAGRNVRANEIRLELKRYQPVPVAELPAAPGTPVRPPDWPDATGTVMLFDLPNLGSPGAAAARILIAAAGSNDGWRGADCWFVAAADAEPVAIGTVRPAAALGHLTEPLAPGSEYLVDRVQVDAVAIWSGGWRFAAARAGMTVVRLTDGARLRFDGDAWVVPPTIAAPSGGSTIDGEARSTLSALILHLAAQGLLISG